MKCHLGSAVLSFPSVLPFFCEVYRYRSEMIGQVGNNANSRKSHSERQSDVRPKTTTQCLKKTDQTIYTLSDVKHKRQT